MFCSKCGKEINDEAVVCIHCGCPVQNFKTVESGKNWLVTLLLCFFMGNLGVHRFYTGYIGIGVAQILTFGGCGIWSLIDFITIVCGTYKTSDGSDLQKNF